MPTHQYLSKSTRYFSALAILLLLCTYGVLQTLYAQTKTYNIAVLLKSTRDKNIRYMLKDLEIGVKKQNKTIKIKQKFIAYKGVTDDVLSQYDVVIVYSQRHKTSLESEITPFVVRNKAHKKLIVVSFYPPKAKLNALPQGVDVLTSASPERYAAPFVIKTVSQKVLKILNDT